MPTYACAELAIGTAHTRPIEIRTPPVSSRSGDIGHRPFRTANLSIIGRVSITPSICKLIHYNCSVKVVRSRSADVCAILRVRDRRSCACRHSVRLRVYFTNNPPRPSRDKSFLEFYLVIEFPGVAGVTLTLARYAKRQVAKGADAVTLLLHAAFTLLVRGN